jgi:hypothetical protein
MSSLLIDTADALVTTLNDASAAETLSQSFTAVREYLPRAELKDMDTLHVTVAPATTRVEMVTRGGARDYMLTIDIGIQKRSKEADTNDDQDIYDPMVQLVEEIDMLLLGQVITVGSNKLHCLTVEEREAFNFEHLNTFRQFTSVSRYTLKVIV